MDNICHTLVGALCAEAGLKTRTRFANATLMIAANLPDIDVAVFATGTSSVAFRRGITHGVLAQACLPPLLALTMWLVAKRRISVGPPAHVGWLIALSYIGVLSHVGLDYLNSYGIRLLMPLSATWFYGDTLFIIDPWLWLIMGLGVWRARRSGTSRSARRAAVLASVYVVLMLASAQAARRIVVREWTASNGTAPAALMVGPRAVFPVARDIIVDAGDHYVTGRFSWVPVSVRFDPEPVPKHDREPATIAARDDATVRQFLVWSRFPRWDLTHEPDGVHVRVSDMRFPPGRRVAGFSAETIVQR